MYTLKHRIGVIFQGRSLMPCSPERAERMVARGRAKWIWRFADFDIPQGAIELIGRPKETSHG